MKTQRALAVVTFVILTPLSLTSVSQLTSAGFTVYLFEITTCWIVGGNSCSSLCAKPAFENIRSNSGKV